MKVKQLLTTAALIIAAVALLPTPALAKTSPKAPTVHAICRDGTLSYSVVRQGTCSHHGGVRKWLR